jgi:hypothetical protein
MNCLGHRGRRVHILRIQPLSRRRKPDQIGEQHADNLPLLSHRRHGGERGSTCEAEASSLRVVLAAAWTNGHAASLGRRPRDD